MVDILHCFPTQRRHIDARARDEGVSARGRHRLDTPYRPWVSLDTAQLPRQPFLLSTYTPSPWRFPLEPECLTEEGSGRVPPLHPIPLEPC